jgi:hypothetical protein
MDNNKQLITKSVRTRDVDKGNNKFDQPYYWCFIFSRSCFVMQKKAKMHFYSNVPLCHFGWYQTGLYVTRTQR